MCLCRDMCTQFIVSLARAQSSSKDVKKLTLQPRSRTGQALQQYSFIWGENRLRKKIILLFSKLVKEQKIIFLPKFRKFKTLDQVYLVFSLQEPK